MYIMNVYIYIFMKQESIAKVKIRNSATGAAIFWILNFGIKEIFVANKIQSSDAAAADFCFLIFGIYERMVAS